MTKFFCTFFSALVICLVLGNGALAQPEADAGDKKGDSKTLRLKQTFSKLDLPNIEKLNDRELRLILRKIDRLIGSLGPDIEFPALEFEVCDANGGSLRFEASSTVVPDHENCEGAVSAELEMWAKVYRDGQELPDPEDDPQHQGASMFEGGEGDVSCDVARKYGDMRPQTLVVWQVVRYYDDEGEEIICEQLDSQISTRTFYGHDPD